MPVTATIIPQLSLVHVVGTGTLTEDELRSALTKCYAQPDYRFGMPEIADMSQVGFIDTRFDIHQSFVKELATLHADQGAALHVIFLGLTGQPALMVEMFRNLVAAQDPKAKIETANGYPEVLALLDLPAESIRHFPESCQQVRHLL